MYLIIFECGTIKRIAEITESELESCEEGLLDIVDLNGNIPKQYLDGIWVEVENT